MGARWSSRAISTPSSLTYPPGHGGLAGPNSRLLGGPELGQVMATHSLSDVWRQAHPTAKAFTHFSASAQSGARLDRFLANAAFRLVFPGAESTILPAGGFTTDHRPVSLTFRTPASLVPRGSGILSFPLEVLNLPEAVQDLETFIQAEGQAVRQHPTPHNWSNFNNAHHYCQYYSHSTDDDTIKNIYKNGLKN